MKSGIYQIRNLLNNKIYIGKSKNLKKRKSRHFSELRNCYHRNKHIQNSFNKDGENNFVFEIKEFCEEDKLIEREQYYIDILKPEYNISQNVTSAFFGLNHTDETKKKISEKLKGRKLSEETKRKIRDARSKQIFSEETKKLLSIKRKGRKLSEETKRKISLGNKGKKVSEETKKKMSESKNGLNKIQVKEIYRLSKEEKISQRKLAKRFKVGKTTIARIINNRNWREQ
jgi:group I intron endonuclease